MRSAPCILVVALAIAFPGSAPAQATAGGSRPRPAQLPADSLERARRFTRWLYTSQSDSLFAAFDSAGRAEAQSPRAVEPMVINLAATAGAEEQLLSERWVTRNGRRQYWRTAKFSGAAEPFVVRWVISDKGEILGLGLNFASQAPPVDP
jgi:hypothetical protein